MSEPLAPAVSPSASLSSEAGVTPVRPPQTLLADAAISTVVVAVCAWQRSHFIELSDPWIMALALFLPVGNLLSLGLSLGAYKLRVTALHYRMALAALFTLYYGYVALHVAGLHDAPLGSQLLNAIGDTTMLRAETGGALLLLLLQTFIATDACQRTLFALQPPPVETPRRSPAHDAVTIIPA
jgi:hypothetical protein